MTRFLLLPILVFGLFLSSCGDTPSRPAGTTTTPVKGITFVDWSAEGYTAGSSIAALEDLRDTGANAVLILVTTYQASPITSFPRAQDPRTPTEASVRNVLARARTLGLETGLKLHVDLDDGTWRAAIDPEDPQGWFAAYGSWASGWADLAEEMGVKRLVAGTELAGTLDHEGPWRRLLQDLRDRYSGELLYAASWDEANLVPFWDALDAVGVDAYFPVASRTDPGRVELLAGWQPWLERMGQLHQRTGLPVILTELGYRSVDGAGLHPYDFTRGLPLDLGEQADLYWAGLEAIDSVDWIPAVFWWNWPADGSGGSTNRDYSPARKPAETELRLAWKPE